MDDIKQAKETNDNITITCHRTTGLQRLDRAVPFFETMYPLSSSLLAFAHELRRSLLAVSVESMELDFENNGWANLDQLRIAVDAIANQRFDASFEQPSVQAINPFTGEKVKLAPKSFKSTVAALDNLCGYQCDWGEEERGRFIGHPPR